MMLGKQFWTSGAICVVWLMGAAAPVRGEDFTTLYGAARAQARQISQASLAVPYAPAVWSASLAERREQWREMLGLSPLPERTPLNAQVTGILERGDYVVEKVYFEAIPGAYVVGNLYRPAEVKERLPAVLYLCGHSIGKAAPGYQAHPRWFAQHGYVALVLDPIQLGEAQGYHHGTYHQGRWDWQSRGYTPAGTEVWNAMRALDYLETRPDVDASRMGVTGLSGGGVISWCLGGADERVKVVVPVCQSGSIEQVVTDRSTDGHCDCAFWINHYRWCWSDVGAVIAPRAFLIASGSEDVLWRPSGYRDVAHRIRKQYAALGAPQNFDLVEDLIPHGYSPRLRKAIFTWFNTHLKGDATPVTDDVTDYVEPAENLLVFAGKLPSEDRMREIDQLLIPTPDLPTFAGADEWRTHQQTALNQLRRLTFRHTVSQQPPNQRGYRDDGRGPGGSIGTYLFDSYDGLTIGVKTHRPSDNPQPLPVIYLAAQPEARSTFSGGGQSRPGVRGPVATAVVEVRNTGVTSVGPGYLWTARRTYPLLGETLPERQVSDLLAGIALLKSEPWAGPAVVYGQGQTAPHAIYAALLEPAITEIILSKPPVTHTDPETPEFLSVLRVGDLPQNLALAWPRRVTFVGEIPEAYRWTQQVYEQLGSGDRIRVIPSMSQWTP